MQNPPLPVMAIPFLVFEPCQCGFESLTSAVLAANLILIIVCVGNKLTGEEFADIVQYPQKGNAIPAAL
ncbi:MAG TPA: hypothetical protein DER33_05130 [Syntrophomonas sp.]|nr:hypothetical protein [Syntrophomonas sp.]